MKVRIEIPERNLVFWGCCFWGYGIPQNLYKLIHKKPNGCYIIIVIIVMAAVCSRIFGVEKSSKKMWRWVAVVVVRRGFGALGVMGM